MLKIIELEIDPELSGDTGVFEVAFVEYPAIEQDFVYFSKQNFFKAPEYVSENACRAIRENEKRGNPAGTQVGKIRAQQLCKREDITLETVKRMKSFLERAATYNTGNWDDNGTIAYGLWGGKEALTWVDKILKQEENFQEGEDLEDACWEGYIAVGLKPADDGSGRMVPNCVPEESFEKFVYPNSGEGESEFISRCIGDNQMNSEFPDVKQRTAVCYSYWRRKDEFSFRKVSFDYDTVLTTQNGRNLLKNEINRGNEVFIVSSRNTATEDLYDLVREYRISPTKVHTVGSQRNKIERIKDLGIETHYDRDPQVRNELRDLLPLNFDYDVSALPPYESTSGSTDNMVAGLSECGCPHVEGNVGYILSQEQSDVFGYKTKNFDMCPGAISLFTHLTSMDMTEDVKGMVRSAAQIADNVFGLEREVLVRGWSSNDDIEMATILVDDFKDLMREIDQLVGMSHDVSFMDNHLNLIESVYDDPSTWDEEEQELFKAVEFFNRNPEKRPENFNQFFTGLEERDIMGKTVFRNGTKFYQYAVKVDGREPSREWCKPREGKFFRRSAIDLLADGNQDFGRNGNSPYSKWLFKGGPICVHAWKQFTYQFEVDDLGRRVNERLVDNSWVPGRPGESCWGEIEGRCFYPGTPRYEAAVRRGFSKEVSRTYMNEKEFDKCFGDVCGLEFTKDKNLMFSMDEEQRMVYTPLMIPNLLIPRVSETGDKYYVKFTPKAVERIQRKFMIEQRLRETNLEHSDQKFNDIVMVESWIVNGESDKAYTLGFTPEQVPTGSWMAGYKVLDTEEGDLIWNKYIKSGKVKGASVEGNFLLNFSKQTQDDYLLDEIIKILNKISQ